MNTKFLIDMADDYKQLYETKEDYDVIIYAGEESNAKEIHAHSVVLRTRSAYFRGALASNWAIKNEDNGCFIFKKPNISPSIFELILKFLYFGDVDIKDLEGETILDLLVASDEFGLTTLIDHVQQYFIENQKNFLQQNPVGMLHIAARHEAFNKIEEFSLETICENPEILFDSNNKYLSLEEDLLILILKHDGLNMDESEIWERVVKWGIAQNTELNDDVTKFNYDDFELLKKTLQRCTQYIRFHDISMPDFYHKILPCMSILPKNLFDDILRCYMVPDAVPLYNAFPSRRNINSILIEKTHSLLFASWIDKKNEIYKNTSPYKFVLLFRGSRDGLQNNIFHQKCDNKGATIVVAKVLNSNQLVGGYAPINWDMSNQCKSSSDSYIFSFSDSNNVSSAELGRVSSPSYAIYCNSSHGPNFGDSQLIISGNYINYRYNNGFNSNNHYQNIGISNGLQIEDYEVFQVIKK
ncbi:11231_t:CDS:2 [Scutellospora calospora]|uniref:11231_t:CDS:1 n=1 Tax=Scutellospora calospora TaxID=85575 RepID=A0ACA9LNR3_9GLOM|nr:11231_t:CDS:2 [Scutellospora calospora]